MPAAGSSQLRCAIVHLLAATGCGSWHLWGWGRKDLYCSVQVVVDEGARHELLYNLWSSPPEKSFMTEVLKRVNAIYDMTFGDYQLYFSFDSYKKIDSICNITQPSPCEDELEDTSDSGYVSSIRQGAALRAIADEMVGRPCLFVLLTHRQFQREDNHLDFSFAVRALDDGYGVCDHERREFDYVSRGNTILLSTAYGVRTPNGLALLLARQIAVSLGCTSDQRALCPEGYLMDLNEGGASHSFSSCSKQRIQHHLDVMLEERPGGLQDCFLREPFIGEPQHIPERAEKVE